MKRLSSILGTTLALWAGLAALASAATLTLTTNTLGAGNAAVVSCGASSLAATRNVDNGGNVTQVTVNGIPQSCSGQTLELTLKAQDGSSLGSATATVGACAGGCSMSFTSFGGVSASSLHGYAFALRG